MAIADTTHVQPKPAVGYFITAVAARSITSTDQTQIKRDDLCRVAMVFAITPDAGRVVAGTDATEVETCTAQIVSPAIATAHVQLTHLGTEGGQGAAGKSQRAAVARGNQPVAVCMICTAFTIRSVPATHATAVNYNTAVDNAIASLAVVGTATYLT